ncbi:MAG: hypothetical protein IKR69_04030 [Bacteroidales bacterium]|nr:hypothetical protein [Bacteroidales bacterium]
MLYELKKAIMRRAVDKRKKDKPFDYQYAENFSLEGVDDPMVNNSYYFSAHDGKMSFYARLGRRVSQDETWFALLLDGKLYSLREEVYPSGKSPLSVRKVDGKWTISFRGILNGSDEVVLEASFTPRHEPIDFTSDMPAVRMATGVANEEWSREVFSNLQNVSGQCHYEQEGSLEGEVTLNGAQLGFCLPCVRDHSFGRRDWNYMNNHLWLMAVSDDLQFNYSLVSYPVMSVLEVGNCRDENGMHYMLRADLDFALISKGNIPRELSLNVRLDDGRSIPVAAKVIDGVSYHFQDGQYILHENIAEFTIDGKECRGILEIGFNADGSRYFNQRDLKSIKR